ncbi:MAG TPA: flagellar hook-associated protein FlgK [Bryobacteraceae bacterium]|nr:flagellar hook-associated protein FlgK [Bryobacteraceae bacterium]
MSSLFSALHASASALDVLNQALEVVQNNVANSSTPGYASQSPTSIALPFDPAAGLTGGVRAGAVQSSRDQFAEQAVWEQQTSLGYSNGQLDGLNALQQLFDVTGNSGIPGALNQLLSSFSSWSTEPDSSSARQQVISAAQGVAQSFNTVANGIQQAGDGAAQQIASTVQKINQLSSAIRDINVQRQEHGTTDAGVDAQLHSDLEQLSQLVNINVLQKDDGSVTVTTGSGTALVIGQDATQLTTATTSTGVQVLDSSQQDISGSLSGGTLAGLLQFRNQTVPGLLGSNGALNQLAQSLADTVNNQLKSAGGPPLFTYTSAAAAAQTLAVSSSITPGALVAASPGPPPVANGTASALAALSTQPIAALGNVNLTDFYSQIAAGIGTAQSAASAAQTTGQQLVAQAQNARSQVSGVSLNEQAAALMQFQQSYQAIAKMISVVDSLTSSVIDMVQQ